MNKKLLTRLFTLTMCAGLAMQPVTAFAMEEPEEILLEDAALTEAPDEAILLEDEPEELPEIQNIRFEDDTIYWDRDYNIYQYRIDVAGKSDYTCDGMQDMWEFCWNLYLESGPYTFKLYGANSAKEPVTKYYTFDYTYINDSYPKHLRSVTATSDLAELISGKQHAEPLIIDQLDEMNFNSTWEVFGPDGWTDLDYSDDNTLEAGKYRIRTTMTPGIETYYIKVEPDVTFTVDGESWDLLSYDEKNNTADFTSPEFEIKGEEPIEPIDPEDPENITGGEWIELWGSTYYMTEDGQILTGMHTVEGELYYFNEKGIMQRSIFHQEDGKIYYFTSDGVAAKGWLDRWVSSYYFDEDGVMQTGFIDIDGNTYYFNEHGHQLRSVWVEEDGKTYYIKADGTMAKGETIKRWGKKYSFDENGVLIK